MIRSCLQVYLSVALDRGRWEPVCTLHLANKAQKDLSLAWVELFSHVFLLSTLPEGICSALQVFRSNQSTTYIWFSWNYWIKYKNFSLKGTVTNCSSWNSKKWRFEVVAVLAKLVHFAAVILSSLALTPFHSKSSQALPWWGQHQDLSLGLGHSGRHCKASSQH